MGWDGVGCRVDCFWAGRERGVGYMERKSHRWIGLAGGGRIFGIEHIKVRRMAFGFDQPGLALVDGMAI